MNCSVSGQGRALRDRFAVLLWLMPWLLALTLFLGWTAWNLETDYFDSYEALGNAKHLAGHREGFGYSWKRPILLPLLFSGFFRGAASPAAVLSGFRMSHLACVFFFLLLLVSSYRLFRCHADRATSAWGIFLLSCTPLIIHYAPFAKEDILATAALTAGLWLYIRLIQKPNFIHAAAAAVAWALAFSSRFNAMPLLVGTIAAHQAVMLLSTILRRGCISRAAVRGLLVFAVTAFAFGGFFLLVAAVYTKVGLSTYLAAPALYLRHLALWRSLNTDFYPASWCAALLVKSLSWPLLVWALLGAAAGRRRLSDGLGLHLLWISAVFTFQAFAVPVKESRLLFPLLPSVCLLAAAGIRACAEGLTRRWPAAASARLASAAVLLVMVGWNLGRAHVELVKFLDPFYRTPFYRTVSLRAAQLAGPANAVRWFGTYYTTRPSAYRFDRRDPFTYIYHGFNHVISFYTGRPVIAYSDVEYFSPGRGRTLFAGPRLGEVLDAGDSAILNFEKRIFTTGSLPKHIAPLIVVRAAGLSFRQAPSVDGPDILRRFADGQSVIDLVNDSGKLGIRGSNIPEGRYELVGRIRGRRERLAGKIVDVRDGRFEFSTQLPAGGVDIEQITLLYFEDLSLFSQP